MIITPVKYHVLGLTPREQLAMRFLLKNAYVGWVDKVISEAQSFNTAEREEKSSYTLKLFDRYNEIVQLLTTKEKYLKAKGVCLLLGSEGMKFVEIATKAFDAKNSYLTTKEVEMIKDSYDEIAEKIKVVVNYTYTKDEIEKAQRE